MPFSFDGPCPPQRGGDPVPPPPPPPPPGGLRRSTHTPTTAKTHWVSQGGQTQRWFARQAGMQPPGGRPPRQNPRRQRPRPTPQSASELQAIGPGQYFKTEQAKSQVRLT